MNQVAMADAYGSRPMVEEMIDHFFANSTNNMDEILGQGHGRWEEKEMSLDDPAVMYTPEQCAAVAPFDEMPSYLMGSSMDLGYKTKSEMENVFRKYEEEKEV